MGLWETDDSCNIFGYSSGSVNRTLGHSAALKRQNPAVDGVALPRTTAQSPHSHAFYLRRACYGGAALCLCLHLALPANPAMAGAARHSLMLQLAQSVTDCLNTWIEENFTNSSEVKAWWAAREARIAAEAAEKAQKAVVDAYDKAVRQAQAALSQIGKYAAASMEYAVQEQVYNAFVAARAEQQRRLDQARRETNAAVKTEQAAAEKVNIRDQKIIIDWSAAAEERCKEQQQRVEEPPPKSEKPPPPAPAVPPGGTGMLLPGGVPGDGLYAGGMGGWTHLGTVDAVSHFEDGSATDRDHHAEGFAAGARLGVKQVPWRFEGEFGYRRNGLDSITYDTDPKAAGRTQAYTFLGNAIYDFALPPQWGGVTPHLGAGIGVAHLTTRQSISGFTVLNSSDTVFAYQGIAGLRLALAPNWAFDL
ncbi:MAG TPA: outer membrane beta-barrel protein, partial [Stellaceae bacterium]|nr:outer membrane beta-barrel protein [Stellaceae bacterium]